MYKKKQHRTQTLNQRIPFGIREVSEGSMSTE